MRRDQADACFGMRSRKALVWLDGETEMLLAQHGEAQITSQLVEASGLTLSAWAEARGYRLEPLNITEGVDGWRILRG